MGLFQSKTSASDSAGLVDYSSLISKQNGLSFSEKSVECCQHQHNLAPRSTFRKWNAPEARKDSTNQTLCQRRYRPLLASLMLICARELLLYDKEKH